MSTLGGKRRGWIVPIALAMAVILFAANAGSWLVVDRPEHSDLIVVLAGETEYRPARALELLRQGYASRILLNVPAGAKLFGADEITLAKQYVRTLPEAAAITVCPIAGLSTKEESRDVQTCLGNEPASRILLVTSDFHTRRALSIFRRELPGKFFNVAAVHDPAQFGVRWWTHRQWAKTCLDEWMRLFWWSVVERWS
ncbi:MAG TPA: YdcF family protein [Candidatus Sulfotelmatobacter sp.]|jgi:uncharacterized SAM-binding protein YcdF (DUF218 family)